MKPTLHLSLLGFVLIATIALGVVVGRIAFEGEDGGRLDSIPPWQEYSPETLESFDRLLARPGWDPGRPPRNPQGMLTAVHRQTGLTFVLLPRGLFRMGSDTLGMADEGPVREVSVSAFLLSATECPGDLLPDQANVPDLANVPGEEALPGCGVSWEGCTAWCSAAEPPLRLPEEAEWEYACRAGSRGDWCFGDDPARLREYAWYAGNGEGRPHPVALKWPNAWGLFDMHGNLWEWCRDPWRGDLAGNPVRGDLLDPGDPPRRVYRGGCWLNIARNCRSANRSRDDPDADHGYLGFRPAASLP